jgi:diguanylate cyclase (GGDEF)-like protein/PAS domain S-box-containing protein
MQFVHFSFRGKIFFLFILYGLILAFVGQTIISYLDAKNIKKEMLAMAVAQAEQIDKEFRHDIANFDAKLTAIEESRLFQHYYEDNDLIAMRHYFLDIAKTSHAIMQLRLLDMDGNEVVRIEREASETSPFMVDSDKLQNKKDRYYFSALQALSQGEFWYSKLDVNVEHGEIQKPIVPVLRIGTPYYFNDKKDALLVINIFMKNFLEEIEDIVMFDVYFIDKDAQVILSPNKEENFSRYLKNSTKKELPFSEDMKNILERSHYMGSSCYAKKLSLNNEENITIVLVPKRSYIAAKEAKSYEEVFYVVLAIIFLSFPLSYFMSLVPVRLNRKVERLNRELNKEQHEQKLLLSLFDLSDSVLFKWKNDENLSVKFVSKSVEKLLGYTKEEFESGKVTYSAQIFEEDLPTVMQEIQEALKQHKFFFEHKPYRVVSKEGEIKWILDHTVVVRDEAGEVTDFLGYLIDITDLKEKETSLEKIAQTDALTQIYNRVYIDEVLLNQYYRYYRNSEECSVIMMDIDHFKSINDRYGHLVGDKVLIEFTKLVQNSIREGDVFGRWGGEEFLLILPYTNIDNAYKLALKIHQAIGEHIFPVVGHVSASFGISGFGYKKTVEDVVEEADKALYEAKKAGRNCIRVYKA